MNISKQNTKYYQWGNNCDSWIFYNTENLSIKYETMPPDASEELHYHNKAQQFFFVLKGEATFYIDDKVKVIKTHEGVSVLSKVKHYISNESKYPIDFLVISQPNSNDDRYKIKN